MSLVGVLVLFLLLSVLFLRWFLALAPEESERLWVLSWWGAAGLGCGLLAVMIRAGTLDRQLVLVRSLVLLVSSLAVVLTVFLGLS